MPLTVGSANYPELGTLPFDGGFVVADIAQINGPATIWPSTLTGAASPRAVLPWQGLRGGTACEYFAVSEHGTTAAAALGDHTDVCGVGPTSVLSTADLTSGTVHQDPVPDAAPGGIQRFLDLSFKTRVRCSARVLAPAGTGEDFCFALACDRLADGTPAGRRTTFVVFRIRHPAGKPAHARILLLGRKHGERQESGR